MMKMENNAAAIAIDALHHDFGSNSVLRGLDLTVRRGEIYALLGGNGAGKSTTLSALLGFIVPKSGTVRVCGVDPVADAQEARAQMAYVPENVSLYEHLSARENIGYFLALATADRGPDAIDAALDAVGLAREAWGGKKSAGHCGSCWRRAWASAACSAESCWGTARSRWRSACQPLPS